MINFKFILYLLLLAFFFPSQKERPFEVQRLTTNHIQKPLGLEENPFFGWQIRSEKDFTQYAYRILVASNQEMLEIGKADLWDSGKVFSDRSQSLAYQGKSLESGQRFYWKVMVWDGYDHVSDSGDTWAEMGLLHARNWKANWISHIEEGNLVPRLLPAPYFRKAFELPEDIKSARLYISGLGYHEAFINGQKVGDHVLDPALTRYDQRVKYVVHDVTELLRKGENVIGVVLGNGWYNQHTREAWNFDQAPWRAAPTLRAQLKVLDTSGTELWFHTDGSWKFSLEGPFIFDGVHNGETYDARKEMKVWASPGFSDNSWGNTVEIYGPGSKMSAQVMHP